MLLSFLKRERGRTVNIFHYSFHLRFSVPARKFLTVQHYNRSPFLTVYETVVSVFDRLRPEKLRNDEERSEMFILYMINGPKRIPNHDHDHASKRKKLFDRNVSNLLIADNSWPIIRNGPENLYMLEKLKRNF